MATLSTRNELDDGIILSSGGTHVDVIDWSSGVGFPFQPGRSAALNPDLLDGVSNDSGGNWCRGSAPYGDGDRGTPGDPSSPCCGNGYCGSDEDTCNCDEDCGAFCGDGCCSSPTENATDCCVDCGLCRAKRCPDVCVCNPSCCEIWSDLCEAQCNGYCGDGYCTTCGPRNESYGTCPADCECVPMGVCGDGCCDGAVEDTINCCEDCGQCTPRGCSSVCDDDCLPGCCDLWTDECEAHCNPMCGDGYCTTCGGSDEDVGDCPEDCSNCCTWDETQGGCNIPEVHDCVIDIVPNCALMWAEVCVLYAGTSCGANCP